MPKSRRRQVTSSKNAAASGNTSSVTRQSIQANSLSEVALPVLLIVAVCFVAVVFYWNYATSKDNTEADIGMERDVDSDYDHHSEKESSRSSQSADHESLTQRYDSLADGIDRDMLPSDPAEDPLDFDDHAAFTESSQQDQTNSNLDDMSEKSRKPPQYLRRDWWAGVVENIEAREHRKLHSNPDVYEVPNLLTVGECYELIKVYERLHRQKDEKPPWCFHDETWLRDMIQASKIRSYEVKQWYEENTGQLCVQGAKVNELFPRRLKYSSTVLVPRGEDTHVDDVELKVEQLGLPTENAYHTQLLKYRGDEEYHPHTDCHQTTNDRMGTILIYLNDVQEGGETVFPLLNVSATPKRGTAIVWKSLDSNGNCEKRTRHASAVLKSGMKYAYQKWFHQMQLLPQYDPDCVLCDNSRSCREYIHSQKTRQATTKMQEAEKLVSSKRFKEALKFYQDAIDIQPNHSMSLVYGADVLMRLGRKHEALHWFQKALKLHPKHVDSNFITANILQEQNKLGLAVQFLEVAVEMSPQDVDGFFNLGAMYAELGRKEEAVSMLRKVVELTPNDAEAHGELGAVLSDMGQEDEAEIHFKKAKDLLKQRRRKKKS